jgi:CRP-like cAMP-binding protein
LNQSYRASDGPNLEKSKTRAEILVEMVSIFSSLTNPERTTIATKLQQHAYDQGDVLLETGTVLQSLIFIANGVVSFTRGDTELLRLGPGDHYGEIGLLTGGPSISKVTALTPVIIYELAKADLTPILEAQPEVAQELGRALAQRQAAGHTAEATELDHTVPTSGLTSWFSERVHRLYNIAGTQ